MFFRKIRVWEVNRHLRPVIKELLSKHIKVTNPDFEDELERLTGIRYRMAKTYLYSPHPWKEVKGNAKIRNFVLQKRKSDLLRKALIGLTFIVLLGFPVVIGGLWVKTQTEDNGNSVTVYEIDNTVPSEKEPNSSEPGKNLVAAPSKTRFKIELDQYNLKLQIGLKTNEAIANFTDKDSLECPDSNENTGDQEQILEACVYSKEGWNSLAPNLKIAYSYFTLDEIINSFTIKSTIPEVVEELRAQSNPEVLKKLGFKVVSKEIIEKASNTTQTVYQKGAEGLTIKETFPGKPAFKTSDGYMVGTYEIQHASNPKVTKNKKNDKQ